ncbi:MAG: TIGR01906 family membrane protein, partial [bacterium]
LPQADMCDAALRTLDGSLARYLKGDAAALIPGNPFNAREMAHMADCFALFELLRGVRRALIPIALLLIAGGAWFLRDRRRIRLCAWLSPLFVLLPLGLFALYAALNFDAAFTLFHKLLFSNDLWLLDPRTDVLIRICPESMFMDMGIRIAAYSLAGMLAVSALAAALTFIWPKGKGVS